MTFEQKVYSNNLPFTDPLPENINSQIERVENNFASLIIIDGQMGSGKTTLAVHIANYINGKQIDYEKQYSMGGQQFTEKMKICSDARLKVLIYDESGDFNRRGALTSFNLMLNRIFETYRAYKIVIILVLPNFSVLDKGIFDKGIPRLLINCYNRKKNHGNFRVYSLYRMFYLLKKMKMLIVSPKAYSSVNCNMHGNFYNLNSEEESKLTKISITGKKDIISEAILKNKGLVDYYEISKKVNRSLIWVKNTISRLEIEHEQEHKRKKYFDNNIIMLLEKEKMRNKEK